MGNLQQNIYDKALDNWLERNSIQDNNEYCVKVLKKFGFKENEYNFVVDYESDDEAIRITRGLYSYRVGIDINIKYDKEKRCRVYYPRFYVKKNSVVKNNKKDKNESFSHPKYFKNNCIYRSIQWIKEDCMLL